jgi:hypothetical protein
VGFAGEQEHTSEDFFLGTSIADDIIKFKAVVAIINCQL